MLLFGALKIWEIVGKFQKEGRLPDTTDYFTGFV
jgi:hypothetical protein